VFAKYKPPDVDGDHPAPSINSDRHTSKKSGRWLLWLVIPVTLLVLVLGALCLILKQVPPLTIHHDPQAAEHLPEKITQPQAAMTSGRPYSLSLTEGELNQWVRDNPAIAFTRHTDTGSNVPSDRQVGLQDVRPSLNDLRIALDGYQLRAYTRFAVYGREVSL